MENELRNTQKALIFVGIVWISTIIEALISNKGRNDPMIITPFLFVIWSITIIILVFYEKISDIYSKIYDQYMKLTN